MLVEGNEEHRDKNCTWLSLSIFCFMLTCFMEDRRRESLIAFHDVSWLFISYKCMHTQT